MEVIKRQISLKDLTNRSSDGYEEISKPFIYFPIFLTQDGDNMGIYSDTEFIESPINNTNKSDIYKDLRPNFIKKTWFKVGDKITMTTDSKLSNLKGYKEENRYKKGFDSNKEDYINYNGNEIKSVSRITDDSEEVDGVVYVFDAQLDTNIGTEEQSTGLLYQDYGDGTTQLTYNTEGINETNSSLSAIIKEDYLMGIISKPEINNDVIIDRGEVAVVEPHLRLSEIETLDHLVRYGNGYFNVK